MWQTQGPFHLLDDCSQPCRTHNEDALGSTSWAAWIIDGTKGPFDHNLTPGPTDATWHAQALNIAIQSQFSMAQATPLAALEKASRIYSADYASHARFAPAHEQPSACLALIASDDGESMHLFNIGDCRTLIEKSGNIRTFSTYCIEPMEREAITLISKLRTSGVDEAETVRNLLQENFETKMNKAGGYWVVHPNLEWLHALQHIQIPLDDIDHVLIASDGFYRLVNIFETYDDHSLFKEALQGKGLLGLHAELRALESADADCHNYPRLKVMDDASALLVRVTI